MCFKLQRYSMMKFFRETTITTWKHYFFPSVYRFQKIISVDIFYILLRFNEMKSVEKSTLVKLKVMYCYCRCESYAKFNHHFAILRVPQVAEWMKSIIFDKTQHLLNMHNANILIHSCLKSYHYFALFFFCKYFSSIY
jgi:hypothetical protein